MCPLDSTFDADAPSDYPNALFGLPCDGSNSQLAILPVPFDATTSYGQGAAHGPDAVLQASQQVDLFDLEYGDIFRRGIFLEPNDPTISAKNDEAKALVQEVRKHADASVETEPSIKRVNAIGDEVASWVGEQTQQLHAANKLVGILGGDHSVPLGAIEAFAQIHSNDFGILHIDAHADLRVAYEGFAHSHASIMHNVLERTQISKLVQVGIRDLGQGEFHRAADDSRVEMFSDIKIRDQVLAGHSFAGLTDAIIGSLPAKVYISFDIDGLDPTLCPNTGTPVPGGLTFHQASYLLRSLAQSGRQIIGFDLCEVAPNDHDNEWNGNVGARILYKLCQATLKSNPHAS